MDNFWEAHTALGQQAHRDGKTLDENPFPYGRAKFAWINGWSIEFGQTPEAKAVSAKEAKLPHVKAYRAAEKAARKALTNSPQI